MTRWPNPPPKGQRCDASVPPPADAKPTLGPVIYMCRELAVETLRYVTKSRGFFGEAEVWLCAEHRDALVELGVVYRNPKKYPPKKDTSEYS